MIRRAHPPSPVATRLLAAAAVLGAGLGVPAIGLASGSPSGGTGFGPHSTSGTTIAQPANGTVSASSAGMTLATRASAFLSDQVHFTGSVAASEAGRIVEVERSGHETGWTWQPTAHARIGSNGSFSVTWNANHIGRFAVRALIEGNGGGAAAAWPTVDVTVYRSSIATQYGPGFYGRRTACGEILRRDTIGVANRTLKCGTRVSVYYQGRTLVVPVIDRGPYANGADWDLTEATGRALHMDGTATIGAVSLPRPH